MYALIKLEGNKVVYAERYKWGTDAFAKLLHEYRSVEREQWDKYMHKTNDPGEVRKVIALVGNEIDGTSWHIFYCKERPYVLFDVYRNNITDVKTYMTYEAACIQCGINVINDHRRDKQADPIGNRYEEDGAVLFEAAIQDYTGEHEITWNVCKFKEVK